MPEHENESKLAYEDSMEGEMFYAHAGISASYSEKDEVSLYLRGFLRITVTLDEWQQINAALEYMKNDEA